MEPSQARKTKGGEDRVGWCATSRHWVVNATFRVVWGDQVVAREDDQWGVDGRYEGRLVEGALKPTCEVKRLWVMHLGDVEDRFEIAWGDTLP